MPPDPAGAIASARHRMDQKRRAAERSAARPSIFIDSDDEASYAVAFVRQLSA